MTGPEFLWIVKESAYGTPKASPTAGVDSMYIRLTDSNSFSMVATPVFQSIMYGGGLAVEADTVIDHVDVKGGLSTLLYPSQATMLLNWLMTPINAGQTSPWTTTEPPGDLASCTVYHGMTYRSGTIKRLGYPGVKCMGGTISASRSSPLVKLQLDLIAQKEKGNPIDASSDPSSGTFPAPAAADFPIGPYTFGMTSGNFVFSSAVSQYMDLTIKPSNTMDPQIFESHWLSTCGFKGRSGTIDATFLFKSSPDFRAALMGLTAETVSIQFNDAVTGHVASLIDFKTNAYVSGQSYDLGLGKEFMQKVTIKSRLDSGSAIDMVFTPTTN